MRLLTWVRAVGTLWKIWPVSTEIPVMTTSAPTDLVGVLE